MKRYSEVDIEKARELRIKEHYSFAHLQRITGIPATTIRNWCSNDFLGSRWDTLLISNERKRQELKQSETSTVDEVQLNTEMMKIFAALIYGCEGAKYPSTNRVALTNSDPGLLKLFVTFLRKSFSLDESKFRVHLQIHDTHNYEQIKIFWSELLIIPASQFIKPTITKPNGKKHRKNYRGTCTLKYVDFRIQLKLLGIFEEFINKFGEVA